MITSLTLQYIVVAFAVLLSAWVVANRQFPHATRRLRVALALPLLREDRPAWLRPLGRWIAPSPKSAGDSCGGCDGCASEASRPGDRL